MARFAFRARGISGNVVYIANKIELNMTSWKSKVH